jgi:ribosomal protein S27AE
MKLEVGKADVRCPKCGSTNVLPTKRGYSIGLAFAFTIIFGVLLSGILFVFPMLYIVILVLCLLSGFAGHNEVRLSCLNCGHTWTPEENKGSFLHRWNTLWSSKHEG